MIRLVGRFASAWMQSRSEKRTKPGVAARVVAQRFTCRIAVDASIRKLPLLAGLLMVHGPFAINPELNAALVIQSPASATLRIGAEAQGLSKEEVIALETTLSGTRAPWLLMDDVDSAMVPTMRAFLPNEVETPKLRRGTMIGLRRLADPSSDSKLWAVVEANGAYAQVAIAGRSFNQIQKFDDVNRPFSVIGAFDDAELLSIINFFRTTYPRIPIRALERNVLGHVLLSLATEPVMVVLGKQDEQWVILAKETIALPNRREPLSPLDRFVPTQTILNHVENIPQ